jgi:transposase
MTSYEDALHAKLERIRFEAVRCLQAGETATTVVRDMGLHTNRIFIWLAAYGGDGCQALPVRKAMGRPKRLEARQIRWIYETVMGRNPRQLELLFALWTRAGILEDESGVRSDFRGGTTWAPNGKTPMVRRGAGARVCF